MSSVAQQIVNKIPKIRYPNDKVIYNREWRNTTHQIIEDRNVFSSTTKVTINGRQDVFSQRCRPIILYHFILVNLMLELRLGMECTMSTGCEGKENSDPSPLFSPENIILLSDGRCACRNVCELVTKLPDRCGSSCAVFSVCEN